MSAAHTPGPWFFYTGSHEIWSEKFDTNTPIAKVFQRIHVEGSEANSRLIAAAPDLLESLSDLMDECDIVSENASIAYSKALKAYNKATGQAS